MLGEQWFGRTTQSSERSGMISQTNYLRDLKLLGNHGCELMMES